MYMDEITHRDFFFMYIDKELSLKNLKMELNEHFPESGFRFGRRKTASSTYDMYESTSVPLLVFSLRTL